MNTNNLPVIRKSNDLIESRYKLSVIEQRLIILLLAEISPSDEDFKDYEITVASFARMFRLESTNSLYEKVQKAANSLVGQKITVRKGKKIEVMSWLSYICYNEGDGVVFLRFDKALKPYLLQLKSHFTQYDLKNIVSFKGQYSIRLYELLKEDAYKAINGQFKKTLIIEELRLIFGLEKTEYPLFGDLKRWAIDPAINEISTKTDLNIIDVVYGKTGKKVTSIAFTVKTSATPTQAIESKETADNHPVIDSLVSLGFSPEAAKTAKNKHGIKRIVRNISYSQMKEKAGDVKDFPAYLKSAIAEDWAAGWEVEQAKKANIEKQKAAVVKETKATKEKATQDKKELYQAAFNKFLLLPDIEQNELKQSFFAAADSTITAKIKEAQKQGIDIFTSPFVVSPFKVFLVERGF
jgi:plasmid replication initiation protein